MNPAYFHQRVAALSASQRETLAQQLCQLGAGSARPSNQSPSQRLVAYVVPRSTPDKPEPTALRDVLKAKLPAYMVPAVIVPLEALPRTANGKIDTKALPTPLPVSPSATSAQSAAPRTPTEETLAKIWRDVLGIPTIGIHDNFFELGGDSILSIQIVSQAREAGLRLAPNQLFEQPTIAELASVVNLTPEVVATQTAVTGPVPLTPIQHWFFEQGMVAPHHWHQALLVELPLGMSFEVVEGAISTLHTHHDALRLRFSQDSTGWHQVNAEVDMPPQVAQIDLSHLNQAEQIQALAKHGSDLHASLNLADGKPMRAVHFTLGKKRPGWLLLSLHHLVVDAVSWQILCSDLLLLLSQSTAQLPTKTTSFKEWAEILTTQTQIRQSESAFWFDQVEQPAITLPQDIPDASPSTEATAHTLTVALAAPDTYALLQVVPAVYNTQINDVLLTALAQTLLEWVNEKNGMPKHSSIRIEVEGHGREQIVPEVDLSRTVGWFTATYPVRLQLADRTNIGKSLKAVKEQLRQIPDRGIGYGMLRYLGDQATQQRLTLSSEVLFNYLGQRESGRLTPQDTTTDIRTVENINVGTLRDPGNERNYLLEINAWVSEGQLQLNWTYDTQRYHTDTIARLANTYLSALKAIITHCTGANGIVSQQGGFTPSDFPDADFSQFELDNLITQLTQGFAQDPKNRDPKNIEAIYPLVPLQQAFLWHSLQTSTQTGLLHMRGTLHGELDPTLLQQAWELTINRHPALRTAVHWETVKQPTQVVFQKVSTPWEQLDWRNHKTPQQALTDFLATDRHLGFDLTQAPITRLTLIRLGETEYELIWTCHHLMLDGWSGFQVVNEVLNAYETLSQGQPLPPTSVPTYQTYIRWLKQQDQAAAAAFWREELKGFVAPTPLPVGLGSKGAGEQGSKRICFTPSPPHPLTLSTEITATLQNFLRSHRLTLSTFLQGIWALLLYRYSGQADVVFGMTVSGRQADLAGVEAIVGLLINVLPVRVKISADDTVLDWLQRLQSHQSVANRYAYASPDQIQTWSECPGRLFESLLVIENYPTRAGQADHSLQIDHLQSGIVSNYGLTLIVKPGDQLTLFAVGRDRNHLQALLQAFQSLLSKVTTSPERTIDQILPLTKTVESIPSPSTSTPTLSPPLDKQFSPPRTPLELKLTQIWEAVLGVSPLGTEASFFDLGGNSLLAVQLFNQMQQQLGCMLPLATLFRAPNVRQFAVLLRQSQTGQPQSGQEQLPWSSLVPIQTRGTRRPFFFHGGSADALTWARFSRLLGADQPFYALQRPDLDGRAVTYATVETLAAKCVEEIRMVQPNGPYIIGGHCFGGAVAFAIANQLQAQGEAIASLVMIDAYCPNALPNAPLRQLQDKLQLSYFWLRKSYYYHRDWQQIVKLPSQVWQRMKRPKPAQVVERPTPTGPATGLSPTRHLPYEERYVRAHQANIRAADNYCPEPYSGQLSLFRANVQILDWHFGPALGWQTVTKNGVKIINIPGLFGNLFNQHSGPLLADQVKAHLSRLQFTL
ncbi:MAG: alpha/beta fold hydrolase [Cyanobacteria bacterium P01_G01_bin.38]